MIKFNTPAKLNGNQLITELVSAGVSIDEFDSPFIDGNGDLWLKIDSKDEKKAKSVVDSHIGIDRVPTIEEKLSSIGLNFEELKAALV